MVKIGWQAFKSVQELRNLKKKHFINVNWRRSNKKFVNVKTFEFEQLEVEFEGLLVRT